MTTTKHFITRGEAESKGFRPLTIGYKLPEEQWMLDAVLNDMRSGNIEHGMLLSRGAVEVWREAKGMNEPQPEPVQ